MILEAYKLKPFLIPNSPTVKFRLDLDKEWYSKHLLRRAILWVFMLKITGLPMIPFHQKGFHSTQCLQTIENTLFFIPIIPWLCFGYFDATLSRPFIVFFLHLICNPKRGTLFLHALCFEGEFFIGRRLIASIIKLDGFGAGFKSSAVYSVNLETRLMGMSAKKRACYNGLINILVYMYSTFQCIGRWLAWKNYHLLP